MMTFLVLDRQPEEYLTVFKRRSACSTNSFNDGAGCKASNVE